MGFHSALGWNLPASLTTCSEAEKAVDVSASAHSKSLEGRDFCLFKNVFMIVINIHHREMGEQSNPLSEYYGRFSYFSLLYVFNTYICV